MSSTSGWSSLEEAWRKLASSKDSHPFWANYLGFYSSWLNGYFREPWGMFVPMDDHGFHRGDGVFEAVRLFERAYIDLQSHLRRLENSARSIGIVLPKSLAEIEEICINLARLCDSSGGILRLYVTRGPGGFSPSPSEVVGHQIYAAITRIKPPTAEQYQNGVRAMLSTVSAKEPFWSQIKSNNYLQNVMMKKECNDKGYDIAISVDARGRVCEGATENLLIVSADNDVLVPHFDYTLRGTTVTVAMKIAEVLKGEKVIRDVRLADLTIADVRAAREVAFVGTTLGVLPVNSLDGVPIGKGKAGPVCQLLHNKLMEKFSTERTLRTPF